MDKYLWILEEHQKVESRNKFLTKVEKQKSDQDNDIDWHHDCDLVVATIFAQFS